MNMNEEQDFRNRLSETAQKVIRDSEQTARIVGLGADTEHLLISLAKIPNTVAYEALRELMINPDRIIFLISANTIDLKTSQYISEDYKKALKYAFRKAFQCNSPVIDTEHLLFGLLTVPGCNAQKVLNALGVAPKQLLAQLEQYFEGIGSLGDLDPGAPFEEGTPFGAPMPNGVPNEQPTRKSAIDHFTTDLTAAAKSGKLDPVVGRAAEIQRATQILIRRIKNNPVLTGEPGVGKTAIVEGLAQKIVSGKVPAQIAGKRILALDLALLVAGTTYRGQFEDRAKKLIDEIIKAGDVILFVDEVHTMVGAGSAEGSMDLSNILKPALAKGKLRLIGATTNDEYRRYIEKDAALERRLQRVKVEEPTITESIAILKGIKSAYEAHHSVEITDEAINSAVELSKRYINDRFLPDKAIDLIDEASAATAIEPAKIEYNSELSNLEKQIEEARTEHQKAAEKFDYEVATRYRVLELRLQNEIEKLKKKAPKKVNTRTITELNIAQVVAMSTGIPIESLITSKKINIANLEKTLGKFIIGQDEAITTISQSIKRSFAGVSDPNRPLGSFIFLGPTGVGKTELVKVMAREVFGKEQALIKIDMSEFMEKHNVSRLVGAPAGYVGYEDAGKLTETVRRQPYSVVLFDEIEKAHPDVFNMLLQIMEDGQLTDAKGRVVNFRNTILVMTSNIGMAELNRAQSIGFATDKHDRESEFAAIKAGINDKLKDTFRPEFLNRLDKVVIFHPLGLEEVKKIVELQLTQLADRLKKKKIEIDAESSAKEFLAEKGFDPAFGARPVRRAITEFIENPLSDLIVDGKISTDTPIRILKKGEKLAFVK